jgi:ABC-2 type transport system permease protein
MTKYWAIFKTQLVNSLAYPADLFSRSISILIFMWIFAQLWRVTFQASTGCTGSCPDVTISGMTLHDTLWYLMLAETILLSKPRIAASIAVSVKDGSIAYLLNKPYHFLLYQLSVGLGDSLMHMAFNVLAGGALVWLLIGPPPSPFGWPFTLVFILLGWLIDFCLAAIIGLAAFVTEDVSAFEWIYQKILFVLGGLLIPLDFYPAWLKNIALSLPFAYTIYGPARFFVDPQFGRLLSLLAGQLIWLSVLALIVTALYNRGVKVLTINGG